MDKIDTMMVRYAAKICRIYGKSIDEKQNQELSMGESEIHLSFTHFTEKKLNPT